MFTCCLSTHLNACLDNVHNDIVMELYKFNGIITYNNNILNSIADISMDIRLVNSSGCNLNAP